jgi:hypothetical protein
MKSSSAQLPLHLEQYSIGIGDRFGHEGVAQLCALQMAEEGGVTIVPVWNKSNREHTLIGTSPEDARAAADQAVKMCGWTASHYVDADHIGLKTVDRFLAASNFFTIDVADFIGKGTNEDAVGAFQRTMSPLKGTLRLPGTATSLEITPELMEEVARKYLYAVEEAGKVYRHIIATKGTGTFVPEISVDEAGSPQTPAELYLILAAIAREGIPVQTIAPKFSGDFLKGIDYVGDVRQFAREFDDDLAVLEHAVKTFHLPENLKLSIHSGSDKFSLYPVMHRAITKRGAGLHLKTAGTTWLEEVIGLASAGGDGLALAREIYAEAYRRYDELLQPYLAVVAIDKTKLPDPKLVGRWTSAEYADALRHNQACPGFNTNFRQLVHVAFKVAAEMGSRYTTALRDCRGVIEANVTENIFARHIQPLFLGEKGDRA